MAEASASRRDLRRGTIFPDSRRIYTRKKYAEPDTNFLARTSRRWRAYSDRRGRKFVLPLPVRLSRLGAPGRVGSVNWKVFIGSREMMVSVVSLGVRRMIDVGRVCSRSFVRPDGVPGFMVSRRNRRASFTGVIRLLECMIYRAFSFNCFLASIWISLFRPLVLLA